MNVNEEIAVFLEETRLHPRTLAELVKVVLDESDRQLAETLAERGGVGYENEDDPQLVKEFTEGELKIRATVAELQAIIDRGDAAERLLARLQSECGHRVFADTPGFPYDVRGCRVCNGGMGLV